VNDVVAYDAMKEVATTLTALLFASGDHGSAGSDSVRAELADLRQDVLTVDGYDRGAVAELAVRIRDRVTQLRRAIR